MQKSLSDIISENLPAWFILNHVGATVNNTAKKTVERFNAYFDTDLELFAPTYVVREERNGEIKFHDASLTFHYVFVRGRFEDVKRLCMQADNKFSFLINTVSEERYAVIDDRRMTQFQNIARTYKNCLPCFNIGDVDLEEGDLVEVVSGSLAGVTGRYLPKAKSKSGNIVLNVYDKLMTIAYDVKSTDVRVLEFAQNTTRANDQMDAFVPHLLKAMRCHHNGEVLPPALAAKLTVFCGRLGSARLNNRKLDGRLQALLYAGNRIIGNMEEANLHRERYGNLEEVVTNEWTLGLNRLIFSVIDGDKESLKMGYEKLANLPATSKSQRMVMEEYEYYL